MEYVDGIYRPSCNGEESFNNLLSPDSDLDPDHLRGVPSHVYTPSCIKKVSQSEEPFLRYARGQTNLQTYK